MAKKTHFVDHWAWRKFSVMRALCKDIPTAFISMDAKKVDCQHCLNEMDRYKYAAWPMGDRPEDFERMERKATDGPE